MPILAGALRARSFDKSCARLDHRAQGKTSHSQCTALNCAIGETHDRLLPVQLKAWRKRSKMGCADVSLVDRGHGLCSTE